MLLQKRVAYISSRQCLELCDKHPKVKKRASLVHGLITSYGLQSKLEIVEPVEASREDLLLFHSDDYIKCLENIQENQIDNNKTNESFDNLDDYEDLELHGLAYDCTIFKDIFDYVKMVTGSILKASELLLNNQSDIVINFNGGWHHAHVDEASGFCYVNDIVIGILNLQTKFKRILYVDLDVHHGDGVEEAFQYSNKVFTLSLHKQENGFFPGTGKETDIGKGNGKYYTSNIPLKAGADDDIFLKAFSTVFLQVHQVFNPDVIVCQCGADALSGDPIGDFNLTSKSFINCVQMLCDVNLPLMILGGGGYNLANTARCWTEIVASVVKVKLNSDIPDHDYLEYYGPDYTIKVSRSNRKNENSKSYIDTMLSTVISNINEIRIK